MLNVALPKGRLADKTLKLLGRAGYDADAVEKDNRKLIFTDEEGGISYFLVKPSDVAIYVEHGVADIGVAGKDILLESKPDVYELLDLGFGKCRIAVAGKNDFTPPRGRVLRVATKFVNITADYYTKKNTDIEVIKLNGSIELAPLMNLSDVIVDLVETGATLRENDLSVLEEIMPVSARLIANKASYNFKNAEITTLVSKLSEVTK